MDSDVKLAIIEKARQMFEKPDRGVYLSFPVMGMSFTPAELDFHDELDDPRADLSQVAEFSRIVNQIPNGTEWQPTEERYLWDAYNDVLTHSVVAEGTPRSDEEEEEYQKIRDFLYDVTDDGLRVPSPELAKYQEFYDANIVLREQLANERVDMENSTDIETRQKWQSIKLPEWRKRLTEFDRTWVDEGFKNDVEQAKNKEAMLGGITPIRRWGEWASGFDPDLDVKMDTGSRRFVDTRYSPINAIGGGSWLRFIINKDVATQLIDSAPPELKQRLEGQRSTIEELDELSFEYSSAKIDRPWFHPELFDARFFKHDPTISNGVDKDVGKIPGYVVGIVFARNIEVRTKSSDTRKRASPADVQVFKTLAFDLKTPRSVISARKPKQNRRKSKPSAPAKKTLVAPFLRGDLARRKLKLTAKHKALLSAKTRRRKKPVVRAAPKVRRMQLAVRPALVSQLKARPANLKKATASATKTPAKATIDVEKSGAEIVILGFICKQLPQSPNPDETLNW